MDAPIRVTWYTDPHNIWCWGFEPTIRRLEVRYPDTVQIETRQGGLFEDFSPVREQWARMSGGRWKDSVRAFFEAVSSQHRMPMAADAMIDSSDDFDSTWPACIAAKAADLQGADQGWRYLRRLREAWCLEGWAIHRKDVQATVAKETGLDVDAFVRALEDGSANDAFQRDRDECQALGISGFPTFVVRRADETRHVDGWRPWDGFEEILRDVYPHLEAAPLKADEDTAKGLLQRYGSLATSELAAILGTTDDDAEILLEELEGHDDVVRRPVGRGLMWELPRSRHAISKPDIASRTPT
ncbi:MAG: DsbA family protein [Methanobacteriota archaeon]|nr:MAG: DsbA family protein [Euryarchaeota archaeon]